MRCFFDTNVLVYIFDERAPQKRTLAQELLSECASQGTAILSVQVLQEFYAAVTRKLSAHLTSEAAEAAVRELARLPIVEANADMVLEAIAVANRYRLAFWDGLIVQAALRGGATVLYTEDLQNGQVFGALSVHNPFTEHRN